MMLDGIEVWRRDSLNNSASVWTPMDHGCRKEQASAELLEVAKTPVSLFRGLGVNAAGGGRTRMPARRYARAVGVCRCIDSAYTAQKFSEEVNKGTTPVGRTAAIP